MLNKLNIDLKAFWQNKLLRFAWFVILLCCVADIINRIWINQDTSSRQLATIDLALLNNPVLNTEWFEPIQAMLTPATVSENLPAVQPKREDSFIIEDTEIKLLAIYTNKIRTALLSIHAKDQQAKLLSLTLAQQTDYFTVSAISRTSIVVTLKNGKKVQLKLFVPQAQKVKNLS